MRVELAVPWTANEQIACLSPKSDLARRLRTCVSRDPRPSDEAPGVRYSIARMAVIVVGICFLASPGHAFTLGTGVERARTMMSGDPPILGSFSWLEPVGDAYTRTLRRAQRTPVAASYDLGTTGGSHHHPATIATTDSGGSQLRPVPASSSSWASTMMFLHDVA